MVAKRALAIPLLVVGGGIELLALLGIWSHDTSGIGQLSAMFCLFLGGAILALGQGLWRGLEPERQKKPAVEEPRKADALDSLLPTLSAVSVRDARDAIFKRL